MCYENVENKQSCSKTQPDFGSNCCRLKQTVGSPTVPLPSIFRPHASMRPPSAHSTNPARQMPHSPVTDTTLPDQRKNKRNQAPPAASARAFASAAVEPCGDAAAAGPAATDAATVASAAVLPVQAAVKWPRKSPNMANVTLLHLPDRAQAPKHAPHSRALGVSESASLPAASSKVPSCLL